MEMDDNLIQQKEPTKRFILRKSIRSITLILLHSTILVQSMVSTIFNTANSSIRASLRITEKTHSIFTFIYHVGQFISAICIILVLRRPDRKGTVLYSVFTTFAAVLFFQFTDNQMIIMPIYFFTGFCIMAMNVYINVWIDQLSLFAFKTIFLSITNLCRALGVSCGLLLNNYFGSDNFKKSFLVESILLGCIGFGLTLIHEVYFMSDLLLYKGKYGEEKFHWKAKTKENNVEDSESIKDAESVYRYRHSGISTKDDYIIVILYGYTKNKRYMCGLMANLILASATAGFSNYSLGFINSYFSDPKVDAYRILKNRIMFTLIGPFCAVLIISILSFFVGNYYSKTTPVFMFSFYLLTSIIGNIIPFLGSYRNLTIASILYTICSSCMGPYLQGCNLSAGTPSKKPFGITISNISGILLGAVPAPYIYATLLKSFAKEEVLAIFMRFLLVGAIFSFLMMVFRCKEYPKNKGENKEEKPSIELIDK